MITRALTAIAAASDAHGEHGLEHWRAYALPAFGPDVLICYPAFGSIWLKNCQWVRIEGMLHVAGTAYEEIEASGIPYMQPLTMNFPGTCVRRVRPTGRS